MAFRSLIIGSALVFATACGPATTPRDAGCVGITCGIGGGNGGGNNQGGGTTTGGGTATGGGSATGGGNTTGGGSATGGGSNTGGGGTTGPATTIAAAKGQTYPSEVNLQGVVVTAISFARKSASTSNCAIPNSEGNPTPGVNASFWVADPQDPSIAVWVEKFRCDGDPDYFPAVGDVLNIKGIIGFESFFENPAGYRLMVKSQFDYIPGKPQGYVCALDSSPACIPFVVEKTGTMAPLNVVQVPTDFIDGGVFQAAPRLRGALIHVAGPLTVTDANPLEMKRVSALPNDNRYFGFRTSNGMLVNNFRTFDGFVYEDGGVARCDPRLIVADGGSVTYPNGLRGVWDTYTYSACADGGTDNACFKVAGRVQGVEGQPDAGYINVLYPLDCTDYAP